MNHKKLFLIAAALLMTGCAGNDEITPNFCPNNPDKDVPGVCGCDKPDVDANGNTIIDCLEVDDACPDDPDKTTPGACGCGKPDVDADGNTIPDCFDNADTCPDDPNKNAPGICGCGTADTDTDNDGTPDCLDKCPENPDKLYPGICGCDGDDTVDENGDGTPDCLEMLAGDLCPESEKTAPGLCGCDTADTDTDADNYPDCIDKCPDDPNKVTTGVCGCGVADVDADKDGLLDCQDLCPDNPYKVLPGVCGCDKDDVDSDNDGIMDCNDLCPDDADKIVPGICGCGVKDDMIDSDGDGVIDCIDACPLNPKKSLKGPLGCDADDSDNDGIEDEKDDCPFNPNIQKLSAGQDCNIIEENGEKVFQIWTASDFKTLSAFMLTKAEENNRLGMECSPEKELTTCIPNDPDKAVFCKAGNETEKTLELYTIQIDDCGECHKDEVTGAGTCAHILNPPIPIDECKGCDEELCINSKCMSCLKDDNMGETDNFACCDNDSFISIESDDRAITCENSGHIKNWLKTGGKPGDICINDYKESTLEDGTILKCNSNNRVVKYYKTGGNPGDTCGSDYVYSEVEGEDVTLECIDKKIIRFANSGGKEGDDCSSDNYRITKQSDGTILHCVNNTVNKAVTKDGKEGDLCDLLNYQDKCLENGNAQVCLYPSATAMSNVGFVTEVPCAFGCAFEEKDARHAACVYAVPLPKKLNKVRLMRDVDLSESAIMTTDSDLNCIGIWESTLLYQADFDGQGHKLTLNDNIDKCAVNVPVFDQIIDSHVYDLKLDLNLRGKSDAVFAKLIQHSNVHDIAWTGNAISTEKSVNGENATIKTKSNITSFGIISSAASDSYFENIDIKGNILDSDSNMVSSFIGIAANAHIKNIHIDIDKFITNSQAYQLGVYGGLYNNTAADITANLNEMNALKNNESDTSSPFTLAFSYLTDNAYRIHINIDTLLDSQAMSSNSLSSSINERSEMIDFTTKLKSVVGDVFTFQGEITSNQLQKDYQVIIDEITANDIISSYKTLYSDLQNTTIELKKLHTQPIDSQLTQFIIISNIDNTNIANYKMTFGNSIFKQFTPFNTLSSTTLNDITLTFGDVAASEFVGLADRIESSEISKMTISMGNIETEYGSALAKSIINTNLKDITFTSKDITAKEVFYGASPEIKNSDLTNLKITSGKHASITDNIIAAEVKSSRLKDIAITADSIQASDSVTGMQTFLNSDINNLSITANEITAKSFTTISDVMNSKLNGLTIKLNKVTSLAANSLTSQCYSSVITDTSIMISKLIESDNAFSSIARLEKCDLNNLVHYADVVIPETAILKSAGLIENAVDDSSTINNVVSLTRFSKGEFKDGKLSGTPTFEGETPFLFASAPEDLSLKYTYWLIHEDCKEGMCLATRSEGLESKVKGILSADTESTVSDLNASIKEYNDDTNIKDKLTRKWIITTITIAGKSLAAPWLDNAN